MTMRSESSTASSTSCVTIITVLPVAATIFISSSCSLARVSASSAPKGSSMSSIFGSIARARAMPTRCFMPPEISPGNLSFACERPTRSSAASERSRSRALLSRSPKTRSTARCTLPAHESHGSSEWFWNTTPRSGAGPLSSRSSSSMCPAVGVVSPATRLSSVLLPQPLWPMRATNSPRFTSRSMSRSATNGPRRVAKVMPTPLIWSIGFIGGSFRCIRSGGRAASAPTRAAGRRCR